MVFTVPFGFQPRSVNAVWGRDVVAVLVLEIALSAAALVIGFAVQARKKDFV